MSLLAPARVQAAPSVAPVFIELISDGCGSSQELGRRVVQRSERIHLATTPHGAVVARAEIQSTSRGAIDANLTIVEPTGKRWSRQVHSATCEETLDAIALVLAVALDPQLTSSEPPPEPPPPPPRARPQPPPEPKPKPPLPEPERPPPPAEPPAPAPAPPPEVPVVRVPAPVDRARDPVAEPPRRTFALVGAAGLVSWGPAPLLMPGISGFVVLGYNRGSVLSPAVQLRAAHFWKDGFAAPGGVADFALDSLAVSVCPIWLQEHRLAVNVCAAGEVGRLSARGSQTIMPQSLVRPFAVVGGSATVMVDLGLGIHITGLISGGAPLIRDSFQFRPEVFYRIPIVVLTTGAGLGMRFL